ncbi:phosphoribosyltransferase-like protein [Brucella pseudogrignonensis]|uniref:phosphoribosyltransferase-like protein n=1 Tax=Brucella pseudogrignonensis TaxID=419475 RepID=UPI003B9E35EC
MISTLGLNLIAELMQWDNDEATSEYGWLQLMSSVKYDGYADFRAGVRFFESLATWLRQFAQADRKTAYDFVLRRLVYISAAEMQRVIEIFVPETVTPFLRRAAAIDAGIKPYEVWGRKEGVEAFNRVLRRSLFIGLSDGSRIDVLRRANAGRLSQEQIVPMMNISREKWEDLGKELRNEQGDEARFDNVYLIDDFTASGTTFIREVNGKWKGKLKKFNDMICEARKHESFPIAEGYKLHIHHYVSTDQARAALTERVAHASTNWDEKSFADVDITEGCLLPTQLKLTHPADTSMLKLCESYYDDQLYNRLKKHCDEAGQSHMKFGYADCAIPLVLEHNTPNNSLSILWAETSGRHGHPMEPLFRRRDRHG